MKKIMIIDKVREVKNGNKRKKKIIDNKYKRCVNIIKIYEN